MQTKAEIESFVSSWVAENVRPFSGPTSLLSEVDRLAARMTGDAREQGISGSELNRAVGDIDDYLTEQHQRLAEAAG